VTQLLQSWPSTIDNQERTRRLIDLFLVSVLLDAGAGTKWSYRSKESGKVYSRSEGLAVASLEMFKAGAFSSDASRPHQVDAAGLHKLTVDVLARGMQVSDSNPMSGLDGRAGLLIRLGTALQNAEIFGNDGRPGNMIGRFTKLTINPCQTDRHRLFDIAPNNPGLISPCHSPSNFVERFDGWFVKYMAGDQDQYSGNTSR
jgi:hypothetical protein